MNMGQRIKMLREQHNLSQLELAKMLNISNSTLSQYENGARTPSDDIKVKLADILDVSIDYLIGRTTEYKKAPTYSEVDALTDVQKEIIALMDKMSPEQQDELLRQAEYQLWLKLKNKYEP